MLVSVVIVDWKRLDLTVRAASSVLSQRTEHEVELVIVVNDADDADVARLREELPRAVVVPVAHNAGFAGGVARGIRAAAGDVLVLLNNDAVADAGFVEHGVAALEAAGPRTAAVAATAVLEGTFVPVTGRTPERRDNDLVAADGTRWRRAEPGESLVNGTGVLLARSGNGRDRDWLAPLRGGRDGTPVFAFSGGAAFLRRSAVESVGGFDESLFMYYEDVDLSWRLRLAGWDVGAAPHAVVVHRHAASSGSDSPLVRYQSIRNRLAVVLRDASGRMIARVVIRTAGRMARDLLRPEAAQLGRAEWARLVREVVPILRHAVRARRRDGFGPADRRRVEASLTAD